MVYVLNASSRDGVAEDVGGVLILRDGQLHGGDAYVYYTGSYECSAGNWQGKITSQEHTPTGRPMAAKVEHIGFFGTYNDAGATPPRLPDPSRRAAGQLATAAATRLRQPLNGRHRRQSLSPPFNNFS